MPLRIDVHENFLNLFHKILENEPMENGNKLKVGSINSIFYFLHKAAEPFNCLEQDNLA